MLEEAEVDGCVWFSVGHGVGHVGFVGAEVEVAVSAVGEDDDAFLVVFFCYFGEVDGCFDGVGGFGCDEEAFGLCEEEGGFEDFVLGVGEGVHVAVVGEFAEQWAVAVVAESAGVDGAGDELVSHGVHFHHGGESCAVAVVVAVFSFGEAGAGEGFDGDDFEVWCFSVDFVFEVGETAAREVAAAADAAGEDVGGAVDGVELGFEFEADDGLVEDDVVEDASECVLGVVVCGGVFDGFADGHA